jgi:hypothetical protein
MVGVCLKLEFTGGQEVAISDPIEGHIVLAQLAMRIFLLSRIDIQ